MFLAYITLYPFDFKFPTRTSNGLIWNEEKRCISIETPGIAIAGGGDKLVDYILAGDGLTIEIVLRTANVDQSGPARIFSFSKDPSRRNFTLGQQGSNLIFRLRTTNNNLNGTSPELIIPGVFEDKELKKVSISYDNKDFIVMLNDQHFFDLSQRQSSMDNWDKDYPLLIANEATYNRPWLGDIYSIKLFNVPLTSKVSIASSSEDNSRKIEERKVEPILNFDFAHFENSHINRSNNLPIKFSIPKSIVPRVNHFQIIPFKYWPFEIFSWSTFFEILLNIALFIPCGFIASSVFSRFPMTYILIFGISLSIFVEVCQITIPTRDPNITDVITNTIGTVLGALLTKTDWIMG